MRSAKHHAIAILVLFALLLLGLLPNAVVLGQESEENLSWREDAVQATRVGALADRAELIALGHVSDIRSFWSSGGATIESETIITLRHVVKGKAPAEIPAEISVRTDGGFIADEDIGMISPRDASFAIGEEVYIYAQDKGDFYRILDGAAGKFSVDIGSPTGDVLFGDKEEASRKTTNLMAEITTLARPGMVRRWRTPNTTVAYKINVNTAQVGVNGNSIVAFQTAITNAAATWNQTPGADFKLEYVGSTGATKTGYNHINEIVFMSNGADSRGALAQVWYRGDLTIIEADIWINEDYVWNVSGDLQEDELDLQSVLLHEFGHWLILDHSDDQNSVMYPTLSPGVTRRHLHRHDVSGISALYPCDQAACDLPTSGR